MQQVNQAHVASSTSSKNGQAKQPELQLVPKGYVHVPVNHLANQFPWNGAGYRN